MRLLLILLSATAPFRARAGDLLYDTFGDGKAEVSSYKVIQPRYGQLRSAYTVLVFVPEDLHRSTRIKVENYGATPPKDRVPVFKLNRTLHFTTGIYDYSAMTSVFSTLQPEAGEAVFSPLKISLTVSEWCGNFYEHLLPGPKAVHRVMHSYFEAEGDREDTLKAPPGGEALYEDSLPVLIRELKGPWLKVGEKRRVKILPSLWESRSTHEPLDWKEGYIDHPKQGHWVWHVGTRWVQYEVAVDYPHYILNWESSTGEKGERMKTLHLPYWEHHSEADLALRKQLGIP